MFYTILKGVIFGLVLAVAKELVPMESEVSTGHKRHSQHQAH